MDGQLVSPALRESLDVLRAERERNVALRDAVGAAERSVLVRAIGRAAAPIGRPKSRIVVACAIFIATLATVSTAPRAAAGAEPRDVSAACHIHGALQPGGPIGIDAFTRVGSTTDIPSGADVPGSAAFQVYGWGQDRAQHVAARGVCLVVDGKVEDRATALYGEPRPDVAKVLQNPALAESGYLIKIPAHTLSSGPHRIGVAVVSADGTLSESTAVRTITVR